MRVEDANVAADDQMVDENSEDLALASDGKADRDDELNPEIVEYDVAYAGFTDTPVHRALRLLFAPFVSIGAIFKMLDIRQKYNYEEKGAGSR